MHSDRTRSDVLCSCAQSEILVHVFESYYCMPGEYAFEWNPSLVPNATTLHNKSRDLAKLATSRAKWFRTPNVLIPWGVHHAAA